ncbi:DUF92 domain-containing protein [Paenibacillus illinoisensis]|uniref:Uncharacterized protein n=1 Tax=Paenibacillus illinoisensis TaxID=59845 RepID=A0A2W0C862_9BACL|nr:DUF92 domain-containing protein [Paenibacillus illinoisensis]PYY28194.1 Uncharacterized protein PIL02S_03340 [Paenibacillus illinoisensis]
MMEFLSILFFAINMFTIFEGPVFSETAKKAKLLEITEEERKRTGDSSKNSAIDDFAKDGCVQLMMALCLTALEATYLIVAIGYDPLKIPTLLAILFFISSIIASSLKKKVKNMSDSELAIEKAKAQSNKNVTFSSVTKAVIWGTYFGYMIYVLVF